MEKKGTVLDRSHTFRSIKSPVFFSFKHISETLEFTKIKQTGLRKERKKNIKKPIKILLKTRTLLNKEEHFMNVFLLSWIQFPATVF